MARSKKGSPPHARDTIAASGDLGAAQPGGPRGIANRTARPPAYDVLLADVIDVVVTSRSAAARAVNAVMTAAYWAIGRRIVEEEQGGAARASYGAHLLERLSRDLSERFGRGFSTDNLETMRLFYLAYPDGKSETASRKSPLPAISEMASRKLDLTALTARFQLPWSHYVRLVRQTRSPDARAFYETEALRGGWTIKQLERQIGSQFYERTLLSRNKAAMLRDGGVAKPQDLVTPDERVKDPYLLEFLGLKDEYSEAELEAALIAHLETFLLELGGDFTFVGRQRRLRVGDEWYRIDLLFYHRRLRCLVVIDLKLGKLTHADAGQMHLYLNYAREHWTLPDENPPVGLILCTYKNAAVAHYALENLPNKVLAAEYQTKLPDVETLQAEVQKTRAILEQRGQVWKRDSETKD